MSKNFTTFYAGKNKSMIDFFGKGIYVYADSVQSVMSTNLLYIVQVHRYVWSDYLSAGFQTR